MSSFSSGIFPNPFHSEAQLIINGSDIKSTLNLEIFDMLGNSVAVPRIIKGNSIHIQRGNLSPGIYEYVVRTNTSELTHGKLVIN